jgi:hypothetical protein
MTLDTEISETGASHAGVCVYHAQMADVSRYANDQVCHSSLADQSRRKRSSEEELIGQDFGFDPKKHNIPIPRPKRKTSPSTSTLTPLISHKPSGIPDIRDKTIAVFPRRCIYLYRADPSPVPSH